MSKDVNQGFQFSLEYQPQEKETFLSELASYIHKKYAGEFAGLHVVFPNRRAGLYFLRELAQLSDKTSWAPKVSSLEDFYSAYSNLVVADRYTLVFRLYSVYREIYHSDESLDNFFFWGEMLLKDFDELDKHLISADHLFDTLSEFKSIDEIEYLDAEQKEIINSFWNSVGKSRDKNNWTNFWSKLSIVYNQFRESLLNEGLGYNGLVLRELVADLNAIKTDGKVLLFAGFNVLTKGEESFISHFLLHNKGEILWDFDIHYLKNGHEAGKFLRIYEQNETFNKSFNNINSDHLSEQKNIKVIGTGTWVGQLKVVGQLLEELSVQPGWEEESTVVVLPDEKLLLPLLNSIPTSISDINVTMGISLRYTSSYSFLENYILLQKNGRTADKGLIYYYKNILNLFRHPLYQSLRPKDAEKLDKHVQTSKKLYYSAGDLSKLDIGFDLLFEGPMDGVVTQMAEIAYFFFSNAPNRLEKIFLNALYHHLERLSVTVNEYKIDLGHDALIRLFRQLASTGRIPFSGEPVKGLQIMGVFETRNIDFDNVFIVSMNEGIFPRGLSSQSFIPFALRRAYRMPTFEDNQSIQSYLFYRLLQRSKKVHLIYNSIGELIGGEVSRYIQQLKYGGELEAEFLHLKESYQPDEEKVISINSTPHITDSLSRYFQDSSYLSPTALNSFIVCKLKFYFKYILRLREEDEVEEEIDAKVYGLLLHEAAEYLYGKFKGQRIENSTMLEGGVDEALDRAFGNTVFDESEGHPRIRKEILSRTLYKLIKKDSRNFPIEIVDVEPTIIYPIEIKVGKDTRNVNIGGKLDRVDKVNNQLRVIDYKTGIDKPRFDDFDRLFEGQNSAAFQLLCYSLLLKNSEYYDGGSIRPELYSMREIFKDDFSPYLMMGKSRKARVYDSTQLLEEFELRLKQMLESIFVEQEFAQTEDIKNCRNCEFSSICRRDKSYYMSN